VKAPVKEQMHEDVNANV